jgi:hypothetical protein
VGQVTLTLWSLLTLEKNTAGQRPTINSSLAVLAAVSEPSLLLLELLDLLLTMPKTAMNTTCFGGRMELDMHNLIEHLIVSRGAIPSGHKKAPVRRLLFSYVRRKTDHR